MKKIVSVIFLFSLSFIFSACPKETSTTYITIKTARVMLYSFDKNGIYPYLDEFNREKLGIGVFGDSIAERVVFAQSFSLGNQAYAFSNPNQRVYTNTIESLNIITLYNFDAKHPAGSNVNDILLSQNPLGGYSALGINKLSSTMHFLRFSAVPQNDSLQFKITGLLTNEGGFTAKTELVILE